jgi:hypothetical protein
MVVSMFFATIIAQALVGFLVNGFCEWLNQPLIYAKYRDPLVRLRDAVVFGIAVGVTNWFIILAVKAWTIHRYGAKWVEALQRASLHSPILTTQSPPCTNRSCSSIQTKPARIF